MKLDNTEFVSLYYSIRKEHPEKSYKDCYEFAETLHITLFGDRKFLSYNSFRQIL